MNAAAPASKRQVSQIVAAWRNGQPDGFILSFDFAENTPGAGFDVLRYLFRARQSVAATVAKWGVPRALSSLGLLGRCIRERRATGVQQLQAVCLVDWLELHGHIPSDEHNGLGVLLITDDGDLALLSRSEVVRGPAYDALAAKVPIEHHEMLTGGRGMDLMLEAFIGAVKGD
jgi:hypothetical protein